MISQSVNSKTLKYTLGVIIILGLVAALFIWHETRTRIRIEGHNFVRCVNNARQIGLALCEFQSEYKTFPNTSTASLLTANHPTHGHDLTSTSSNALFLQLLAAQITQSEYIFYARIPGAINPDGIISPGEALKKGEVGFSYISGLSSKNDPLTPIVLTPLIPGTTKFDPKPFKGKAIVLQIDNTARIYKIEKDGHIYDEKGINLLSPTHPIWNGKPPTIHYPE